MGATGGSLGMPGRNVSLAEMRGFSVIGLARFERVLGGLTMPTTWLMLLLLVVFLPFIWD